MQTRKKVAHRITTADERRVMEQAKRIPLTHEEVNAHCLEVYRCKFLTLPSTLIGELTETFRNMGESAERLAESMRKLKEANEKIRIDQEKAEVRAIRAAKKRPQNIDKKRKKYARMNKKFREPRVA
jgi:hypothetical protein